MDDTPSRRSWLALAALAAIPAFLGRSKVAKADVTIDPNDPHIYTRSAGGTAGTRLVVVNEYNNEDGDYAPRGFVSVEASNTDHSAHFEGWKCRGTWANPQNVVVGDYVAGFVGRVHVAGFQNDPVQDWPRIGYFSHYVTSVYPPSTNANIKVAQNGEEVNVYAASADETDIYAGGARLTIDASGLTFHPPNGGAPRKLTMK